MKNELTYEELNNQLEESCHIFEDLIEEEKTIREKLNNDLQEIANKRAGTMNHIQHIKEKMYEIIDAKTEGKRRKYLKEHLKEVKGKYIIIFNPHSVSFFKIMGHKETTIDELPPKTIYSYSGTGFDFEQFYDENNIRIKQGASISLAFNKDYPILPKTEAETYIRTLTNAMCESNDTFLKTLEKFKKKCQKYPKLNMGEQDELPENVDIAINYLGELWNVY